MKTRIGFIFAFFLLNFYSFAGKYFWVGGTGDWSEYNLHWATSSGGMVFHNTVPSLTDTVYFDQNSFSADGQIVSVNINAQIFCHTIIWENIPYRVKFNDDTFSGNFSMYVANSFIVNGQYEWFIITELVFTGVATHNFKTGNNYFFGSLIYDNGPGSTLTITDSLKRMHINHQSGKINLTSPYYGPHSFINAAFDPGSIFDMGQNVITTEFFNQGHGELLQNNGTIIAESMTLHSDIHKAIFFPDLNNQNQTIFNGVSVDSLIVSSGGDFPIWFQNSSEVNYLEANTKVISTGLVKANTLSIFADFVFNDGAVLDTFHVSDDQMILYIGQSDTLRINSFFNAITTCNDYSLISSVGGLAPQAVFNYLGPATTLSHIEFEGINNVHQNNLILNDAVDLGNNSGLVFGLSTPRELFWVGGSGAFNDLAHWSLSSGGNGGECPPTSFDNVFFDSGSGILAGDTVYFPQGEFFVNNVFQSSDCNSILFYQPVFDTVSLHIGGSLVFQVKNKFKGSIYLEFNSTDSIEIFTGNSNMPFLVIHNDEFVDIYDSLSFTGFNIQKGIVVFHGDFFEGESFLSQNVPQIRKLILSNNITPHISSWNTNLFEWNILSQNIFVKSLISINDISSFSSITVLPRNSDYSFVQIQGGAVDSLKFECNGFGCDLLNTDVTCLKLDSKDGGVLLLDSRIKKFIASGQVRVFGQDYANSVIDTIVFSEDAMGFQAMNRLTLNGPITNNALCGLVRFSGADSISHVSVPNNLNLSNVFFSGVNFIDGIVYASNSVVSDNCGGIVVATSPSSRNLFWVNGTGNWSDSNHWSLVSGGPGGECPPTIIDDVFFDQNSLPGANDSVCLRKFDKHYCRNLNWNTNQGGDFFGTNYMLFGATDITVAGSISIYDPINSFIDGWLNFLSISEDTLSIFLNPSSQVFEFTDISLNTKNAVLELNSNVKFRTVDVIEGGIYSDNFILNTGLFVTSDTLELRNGGAIVGDNFSGFSCDSLAVILMDPNSYIECGAFSVIGKQHCGNIRVYLGFGASDTCWIESLTTLAAVSPTNISSPIYVECLDIRSDLEISSRVYADSVYFNNPGYSVVLPMLDTLFAFDYVMASISPGAGMNISSSSPFYQSNLYSNADTVCLDYTSLSGINAIGAAVFYAGANSNDFGNNSGWLFNSCQVSYVDVWPGDANSDLIVDNNDILSIGLANNESGFVRPNADPADFSAQLCMEWDRIFSDFTNLAHADCNGDGTINSSDTLVVNDNYGLTHPGFMPDTSFLQRTSGLPLSLSIASHVVTDGIVLQIPILFGDLTNQVDSVYGLSFKLNMDGGDLNLVSNMSVNFYDGWIAENNSPLIFQKGLVSQNRLDLAISRTNHMDIGGYGLVGVLNITIPAGSWGALPLVFEDVKAVKSSGEFIAVEPLSDTIYVNTFMNVHLENQRSLCVFPNPAKEKIQIVLPTNISQIQSLTLIGVEGKKYLDRRISFGLNGLVEIDISDLDSGYYTLLIQMDGELYTGKICVLH